ncbi:MAG: PLP-dependent transferase [Candidatus Bathyarchaeota archaeon]|nr:MAG: PLP-dependent transferase [Candidatus Bathyarchaeota archaeon]
MDEKTRFSTQAVHAGEKRDPQTGSIITPIYQTSNFAFPSTKDLLAYADGKIDGYIYTRYGNPTLRVVERKVAQLEDVADAVACGSGMAAITMTIMSLVSRGDHIVAIRDIYGGTYALLKEVLPRFGVETSFVEATDIQCLEQAVRTNTRIIFIESPTNPTLKIVDLAAVASIGRRYNVPVIIDNTFATPYNQQPSHFGIDLVLHSATKYFGGHSDLTAGIIAGSKSYLEKAKDMLKILGGVLDPHAAWLLLRGLKTLGLRIEKQNQNGIEIAKYLESHSKVRRVYYPGLENHPQHSLAKRQMKGFGGVVSFEVDGDLEAAIRFVDAVHMAYITPSLGGAETLITQPATTSHYRMAEDERLKAGITNELIRLSLGIEDAQDIIADLDQAFDQV